MEAVKMSRALIIFVLSVLTLQMAKCDEAEDRHLCHQSVTVSYTEEVPRQLEEFGDFEKYFQQLGIPGGNKTVTKTRLKDELVCCPGYIKSEGGDCVRVETTTESTTEEFQTSTEETSITSEMNTLSPDSNQQTKEGYLPYLMYAALAIGVLVVLGATVSFLRTRKPRIENSENYRVKFDAEMQKALI